MKTTITFLHWILLLVGICFFPSLHAQLTGSELSPKPIAVDTGMSQFTPLSVKGTRLSEEDFNQGLITDPLQLFQARLPALMTTRAGNDPNAPFDMRSRGIKSFDVTEPLVVIDGIPVASLHAIHPQDIESVQLLRGGAEAAAWGIRGANGVLLIKTKRGESGKARIRYHGYLATENITQTPDLLDGENFVKFGGFDLGHQTDWWNEITSRAISQVHHVSLSGGANNSSYYASLNYDDVEGIALQSGFNRINGRLSFEQTALNNRLTLRGGLSSTHRESSPTPYYAFWQASSYNPTAPIKSEEPEFEKYGGYFQQILFNYYNPVALIEQNVFEHVYQQLMVHAEADLKLSKGIHAWVRYGSQSENRVFRSFSPSTSFYIGQNRNGLAEQTTSKWSNQYVNTGVRLSKKWGKMRIHSRLSHHYQDFQTDYFHASGGDFLTNVFSFHNLSAANDFANGLGTVNSRRTTHQISRVGGEINLEYDHKYSLRGIVNREGSSILGPNNKWGTFFGVMARAQFTEDLSFRSSFGLTGNLPSGRLLTQQILQPVGPIFFNQGMFTPSYVVTQMANPDLQWEQTQELTVGLDFRFWEGRLRGSLDYYRSQASQIIKRQREINSNTFTFEEAYQNVGAINSSGLEYTIFADLSQNPDLEWEVGLMGARYFRTQLVDYGFLNPDDQSFIGRLGGICPFPVFRIREGEAVGDIWGFILNPNTPVTVDGGWGYTDITGDGRVDDVEDKTVIGNALPKSAWGLSNRLKKGNWELDLWFRGVFGHDIVNHTRSFHSARSTITSFNILNEAIEKYPTVTDFPDFFDKDVEKGSFLRLSYLSLGYDIDPQKLLGFQRMKVYITAQNLFTITAYQGLDPEFRLEDRDVRTPSIHSLTMGGNPLVPGMDRRNAYPTSRAFVIGIKADL